jgi:hypothetical protein
LRVKSFLARILPCFPHRRKSYPRTTRILALWPSAQTPWPQSVVAAKTIAQPGE